jgi:hypothetical protein
MERRRLRGRQLGPAVACLAWSECQLELPRHDVSLLSIFGPVVDVQSPITSSLETVVSIQSIERTNGDVLMLKRGVGKKRKGRKRRRGQHSTPSLVHRDNKKKKKTRKK